MDGGARPSYQDTLLRHHLQAFFADVAPEAVDRFREHLTWVDIRGGETLLQQGDPGDALYLLVSGRLRTYVTDEDGAQRMLREVPRGEIVGEMSLYTGEPRSATVVAIRDSVLARLGKDEFDRLLLSSGQVSVALTRQIIRRLRTDGSAPAANRPVTIGLIPVTDGVETMDFAQRLGARMGAHGRVRVLDSGSIEHELQRIGADVRQLGEPEFQQQVALLLDKIEADNDFVLLVGDDAPTDWTRRCTRHADELLLLADAGAEPRLHPTEERLLMERPPKTEAAEVLVLLHPAQTRSPRNTAAWLARRPVADHLHIRSSLDRDMGRLARIQSRTAVGLVLAGGGARGFAHLGVYRALQEQGVEVDYVGGTSMGAVMGTYVASGHPLEVVAQSVRRSFRSNPTGDYNVLPLLSLIKGGRLRRVITAAVHDLFGFDADIEDLWINFFCVTTNYSRASEHVLRHGNITKSLLASVAIPGALPPVLRDGELFCDGGTFNNFPVDVMARMRGVGKVIGIDLSNANPRRIELEEMPSAWSMFRDRFRGRNRRRFRLPSLASYLMNVTILYSVSRQRQARRQTDLYFNPPLHRIGMLQWHRHEQIAEQGYAHAKQVLAGLSEGEFGALQRAVATLDRPEPSSA
jgi:NTE family protein